MYFELIVSTAEDLIDKQNDSVAQGKESNMEQNIDKSTEEYEMIKQMIEDLDDNLFMTESLRQLPEIRNEEKIIISEILN